ncbi:hypothetical protein N657DRAFT_596706 [Parathielavia appendiculata]|uniref:YMC020W-like alpha/beta hydrolase domain-containing protein n=1 Tax=Parathielavia appendiculata TaxID=2587402 RepID=A0AAN6TZX1_9PEZI|nr:hypothetical protein N657DRAFT_596706 [Parathielavia appendiculata]
MGSRKRVKANPAAESSISTPVPPQPSTVPSQASSKSTKLHISTVGNASSCTTTTAVEQSTPRNSKSGGSGDDTPAPAQGSKQVQKTRSWHGSWPRGPKSAASTHVARETILGGTSKPRGTADFSIFETKKPADAMGVAEEPSSSGSSVPDVLGDSANGVDRQPEPELEPVVTGDALKPDIKTRTEQVDAKMVEVGQEQGRTESPPEQALEPTLEQQAHTASTPQRPTSGWFGWLGSSGVTESVSATVAPALESDSAPASTETQAPETKSAEEDREVQPTQGAPEAVETPKLAPVHDKPPAVSGSSWLWSWSIRSTPAPSEPEPGLPTASSEAGPPAVNEPGDVAMQEAPAAEAAPEPLTSAPKAGSTWAFWSRDAGAASRKKPAVPQSEQGQLAVMGERSENHPQRANSVEFQNAPAKEPQLKFGRKEEQVKAVTTPSRESSTKSNKRVWPKSIEVDDTASVHLSTAKADTAAKPAVPKATAPSKALPRNLLLPAFTGTYTLKENPSIIKQLAQLLLRTQQPSSKHVYLTKEHPKIQKAIAIGVHGLFPANYLRPMIGQPTGTSIKFANHCADAIRRWADSHGCEDCVIEKVALEGEGKIGERVENLWKLLLNWIEHIRDADLVLIACHSQGVPVSIMLLAKLIELGVVASARVGVCAMAGVSLGPFPDYRSSMGILMGSAAELWEFADPQSEVSKRLETSIKAVLSYGARLTFIGSIDDQLVPLESAIYSPAHHPYIYRAVFIDGRIHAPDFIAHLVGFALKLRNLGVSDHGLIRELSTPLAGSLYSGEGHSRLYDDTQVYDLAVTHALETTDVIGPVACEVRHRQVGGAGAAAAALSNPNPYHLPWIMRGLLEEDFVKTELSAETDELVRQFDDWKPVTKALKDVKYRLEAVRSKL